MKFNYDIARLCWGRGGDGWGGIGKGREVYLRRSKRRRHLPKIRAFKKFGQIIFWTDRQTLWFIGKLHVQKYKLSLQQEKSL